MNLCKGGTFPCLLLFNQVKNLISLMFILYDFINAQQ